jgi:undecaprenyl-diphosphatase
MEKGRFARLTGGTALLAAFLIVVGTLLLLAGFDAMLDAGLMTGADRALLLAFRDPAQTGIPIGGAWLRSFMFGATALGATPALTLVTTVVAGFMLVARRWATSLFLVLAITCGSLADNGLKLLFFRARPELVPHLVEFHNASFPSGHAFDSAVAYLTIAAVLGRTTTRRGLRIALMATAILLTFLVGVSRVYLGVHWPTDVLAGWFAGAAWALACALLARSLQRRRAIEPEG